ncbi:MAG: FecR domain-containing protein [Candidatus Marinarcus sp.]|uniref:FecR domain-containing protein n=1 Tax=Candidatus Marinarcus sp. TaxID=3100987 RepID=UPI003B00F2CE
MKKILLLLFILANFLFASIGQITALVGDVKISRDSNTILAKLGEELEKNDVINSSKGSKAQITMNDNTIITIGQNSTLNIFDYVYDANKPEESKASFGFMKGSFKSITGVVGKINKEKFKLKTKSSSIGIRGTTIIGNQQIIICTDGAISVTANNFTVNVDKQEFTRTLQGQAPTPPEPLKQETLDSVQKGLNAESSDSNTTESTETKESTTSTEEEKEGSKDDKDGTLTPTTNNDNKVTTPKETVTPPSDTTPPKILKDTPPVNPDKPKINPEDPEDPEDPANPANPVVPVDPINPDIPTSYIEHANLSGFSSLGYVITAKSDGNSYSLQTGEVGINNNYNSSLIIINNQNITDANFDETTISWSSAQNPYDEASWIASIKTDTSEISSLINNTSETTKSFGFPDCIIFGLIVDNNTLYYIDASVSSMNFSFNFGAGVNSFTGSMNLEYVDSPKEYAIKFANGKINSSGFSSSELTHSELNKNDEPIKGSLHGSFYGSGANTIAGNVNFDDEVNNIQGAVLFSAGPN